MLAVLKRELDSYYYSAIGYVFMGCFLLIAGIFFTFGNIMSASSSVGTLFSNITFIFILIVPILTMKLMSDERKSKTDQLLLTSPLSLWSIVLGKFFAACTVFLLTLVCTGVYVMHPLGLRQRFRHGSVRQLPGLLPDGLLSDLGGSVHVHPVGKPGCFRHFHLRRDPFPVSAGFHHLFDVQRDHALLAVHGAEMGVAVCALYPTSPRAF